MEKEDFVNEGLANEINFETTMESLEMVALKVIMKVDFRTQEVEETIWNR